MPALNVVQRPHVIAQCKSVCDAVVAHLYADDAGKRIAALEAELAASEKESAEHWRCAGQVSTDFNDAALEWAKERDSLRADLARERERAEKAVRSEQLRFSQVLLEGSRRHETFIRCAPAADARAFYVGGREALRVASECLATGSGDFVPVLAARPVLDAIRPFTQPAPAEPAKSDAAEPAPPPRSKALPRGCVFCGAPIAECMGYVLPRDVELLLLGRWPKDVWPRELCPRATCNQRWTRIVERETAADPPRVAPPEPLPIGTRVLAKAGVKTIGGMPVSGGGGVERTTVGDEYSTLVQFDDGRSGWMRPADFDVVPRCHAEFPPEPEGKGPKIEWRLSEGHEESSLWRDLWVDGERIVGACVREELDGKAYWFGPDTRPVGTPTTAAAKSALLAALGYGEPEPVGVNGETLPEPNRDCEDCERCGVLTDIPCYAHGGSRSEEDQRMREKAEPVGVKGEGPRHMPNCPRGEAPNDLARTCACPKGWTPPLSMEDVRREIGAGRPMPNTIAGGLSEAEKRSHDWPLPTPSADPIAEAIREHERKFHGVE